MLIWDGLKNIAGIEICCFFLKKGLMSSLFCILFLPPLYMVMSRKSMLVCEHS